MFETKPGYHILHTLHLQANHTAVAILGIYCNIARQFEFIITKGMFVSWHNVITCKYQNPKGFAKIFFFVLYCIALPESRL